MNGLMKKKMSKKGQAITLSELMNISIIVVVIALVVTFGVDILDDTQADFVAGTAAYNATADGITGVSKISSKLPIIVTVVVAVIIIGLLFSFFAVTRRS